MLNHTNFQALIEAWGIKLTSKVKLSVNESI
jgi:hypothetical protein